MFDSLACGQAIKRAREAKGWTREKVAEIVDLAPRYIMSIENTGQHLSLKKFYLLMRLFDISVDQYFYPDTAVSKTSYRRQLDTVLDSMDDTALTIVNATAKAVQEAIQTLSDQKKG
jgi:transcriptional regulator with XRE-family HTH domain